jgi:hypothetical protein
MPNEHFSLLILNIYPVNAENIIAMLMEQNYLKEKISFNPSGYEFYSAGMLSIAVIVNFISLPWISNVKSSLIFFPITARAKGDL